MRGMAGREFGLTGQSVSDFLISSFENSGIQLAEPVARLNFLIQTGSTNLHNHERI
jgi:hypothetical protein